MVASLAPVFPTSVGRAGKKRSRRGKGNPVKIPEPGIRPLSKQPGQTKLVSSLATRVRPPHKGGQTQTDGRRRRQRLRPSLVSALAVSTRVIVSRWHGSVLPRFLPPSGGGGARQRIRGQPLVCARNSITERSANRTPVARHRLSWPVFEAQRKRLETVRRQCTARHHPKGRTDHRIWSLALAELSHAEEGGLGKSARWRRKFATRRGSGGWPCG